MVSEQKCCQNLDFSYILLENFAKIMEGAKKTKVWVPKRWRVPKKVFGVLRCQYPNAPNLCVFFGFFWDPPACWQQNFVFFGTPQGFGKVSLQNAPKTLRGTNKNQSFGAKTLEGPKTTKGVLSCQTTPCSKTLCFYVFLLFFWDPRDPPACGEKKLWFFWYTSRF